MVKMKVISLTRLIVGVTLLLAQLSLGARADEQYFPLQSYRVGPYAAAGSGFFGGFIDYLQLVNHRAGGVNCVKLTLDDSGTQDDV